MRWRMGLWLVGLLLVVAACSSSSEAVGDEPAVPEEDSADDVATSDPSASGVDDSELAIIDQEIDWERCFGGAECARILVPQDYDDPDGKSTEIAVTRTLATDPANRIGTLFVNPGGPGFGADFYVQSLVDFGPRELSQRFDIVGIDPRGTGSSNAIDCNSNWEEDINTPLTLDDGLADDIDLAIEDFVAMGAECVDEYGVDYLASITTENLARDHEAVRILLGGEPMNFLGASYGTTLGSVYATMFPDNIRSLVLDGAVLPDAGLLIPDEIVDLEIQLERLDASCEAWADCPLPDGWIAAAEELEATLEKGPIGPLTLGEFFNTVGVPFSAPSWMPDLAFGMADALDGDGTTLDSLNDFLLTPLPGTGNPAEYAGGLAAIHCADGIEWSQVDSTELLSVAEDTAAANPDFGPFIGIPCDLWPVQGDGLPAIDYRGDAPVLVIGNTGDAITPLRYAEQMAEAFGDQARLLTWDATGHVAFSWGSSCIDDLTMAYLIDLTLPDEGTICPLTGLIGIELEEDLTIIEVIPESPAALAGFQVADRIISIDGVAIEGFADFPTLAAGDTAAFVVDRNGESVELSVAPAYPEWELWRLE